MFQVVALKINEDENGLPDRAIEVSVTRPDGEEFVNRVWLRKDLRITKTMVSDDAFTAICETINEMVNTPIPMPDPPKIAILNPKGAIIKP